MSRAIKDEGKYNGGQVDKYKYPDIRTISHYMQTFCQLAIQFMWNNFFDESRNFRSTMNIEQHGSVKMRFIKQLSLY